MKKKVIQNAIFRILVAVVESFIRTVQIKGYKCSVKDASAISRVRKNDDSIFILFLYVNITNFEILQKT